MARSAVLLLICVGVALAAVSLQDAKEEFIKFQRKYNKEYSSDEFTTRFSIFRDNLERAEAHQKLNPYATFGVTQFSDLHPDEFARYYLNRNIKQFINNSTRPPVKTVFERHPLYAPDPNNYDWNSAGVVTGVYNQGQCGSCWAFSATETIESYNALSTGSLVQLSMEQIVDCDTTDQGCNGGLPSNAYQYVENAGGIEPYADYPYDAGGGQASSCSFNSGQVQCQVTGYNAISGESGIYQQLSTGGPVSVCVDASSWQYYSGGVLTTCTNNIDHCVQATGYTNYSGGWPNAYWNVRNSWGTQWGENGYIWVAIGQDLCAIGDEATIASAN